MIVGQLLEERPLTANGTLKVLFVIDSLGGGGAERSLAELLPHYTKAGIDPILACLKQKTEGVESEVRRLNIPVVHLGGGDVWSWTRGIRRLARARRVDLIHTALFESDVAGRLAAWRTGIPVLTSLVNTSYASVRLSDPNIGRWGLGMARAIDGWTARHLTTHFHAISQTVKDASVEALGIDPARITVVERGRDTARLGAMGPDRRRAARALLGLGEHDEVLVNVGRQEFQKGQKTLLQAMAEVLPRRPQARLLIAGRSGNATPELSAEHARLRLGDRVRFLGFRRDVPEVLAAADAFVFPSLFEGAGGALLEAMALGLPIVASDIPSSREVAGECAQFVRAGSADSLARGIEALLDDRARARELGERASRVFRDRFTLERSAGKMVDLYRGLIDTMSPS